MPPIDRLCRAVVVALLVLGLGGCSWTDGGAYRIQWTQPTSHLNFTVEVTQSLEIARTIYYEDNYDGMLVVNDIAGVSSYRCYAGRDTRFSYKCVMGLIERGAGLDGRMGAYFSKWLKRTDEGKVSDFLEALRSANNGSQRCLTSSFKFVTPGANNWTYRAVNTSECRAK